jgi:hypothetical protein
LFRRDSDYLNTFAFNALADPLVRVELAERLGKTEARVLERRLALADRGADIPGTVVGLLRDLIGSDVADGDLERMESGWRAWIAAEEGGLVRTVPWQGQFDLASALLRDKPLAAEHLDTPLGRDVLNRVQILLARSRHRSDITMLMEQFRGGFGWRNDALTNPDDPEASDLSTIDRWYSVGRYLAAARQHDADLAYVFAPRARPVNLMERLSDRFGSVALTPDVVLADELLPNLAVLDNEQFAQFTHRMRPDLLRLWRTGPPASARRVMSELNQLMAGVDPPSSVRQRRLGRLTWMSMVAGPAAGLGAEAVTGSLSSMVTASLAAGTAVVGASIDYARSRPASITMRRVMQYLRRRAAE